MSETGFLNRATQDLRYVVYVPRDAQPSEMPCILFMHGSGESGEDGLKQTAIGLPHAIRCNPAKWPFLVVMPQKPSPKIAWKELRTQLNQMLKEVAQEFRPDPHRLYITGLSQGGYGAFALANHLDWRFAAAAPVCGWADMESVAEDFRQIPIWAFHGEQDDVVRFEPARDAIQMLQSANLSAEFTLYPEANHNSWDQAYGESDLPAWFLRRRLA